MSGLTVLAAPDSFKGSLTSVEAAEAMAEGWRRARPGDRVELAPLADGGDGTLEAVFAAGGWGWQTIATYDALRAPIEGRWLRSADGSRGVVALAETSGLARLGGRLDPYAACTFGTGHMISAVLDAGVRKIVLGIGGSATNDGGRCLLEALGASTDPRHADVSGMDPRLGELELRVACDVTNPLLGPAGATAIYGPQKGIAPDQILGFDGMLAVWADALEQATGRRERDTPGAGAAGGVGFALLCIQNRFRRFELVPGVDLVMEETGFARRLAASDAVVTGEGRIDAQTGYGKTVLGVARRALDARVRCFAIGGSVTDEGAACLREFGCEVEQAAPPGTATDDAMREAGGFVAAASERLARRM